MPADGGGIEKNIRPAQAAKARAFGIPLIPANQNADPAVARVEVGETQIARREIKLLVVERIVWDVHLAIKPEQRAIGVEHYRRIVIKTGGAALEDRRDDDDVQLARELAERFGGGTGDRFGQVKIVGIFFAAEILRAEKLFETDDLRAALGCFADGLHRPRKICGRIFRTSPLQQADGEFLAHEGILPDQRRGVFVSAESMTQRMRRKTESNIAGVSRPVCVFCWLGW